MKNVCRFAAPILLIFMAASCATTKAVDVNWPEAQSVLGGKKAVILNFEMADRTLASSGGAWAAGLATILVGGIFYITLPQVLSNAQFNSYVRRAKPDVEILQNEQKPILTGILTEAYKTTFNAEVTNVDFPFNDTKITLNYFTKPTPATREAIAAICADNGAEYLLASVCQIRSGGRGKVQSLSAESSTRETNISTNMVIFDKTGNIAASGYTHTPNGEIRMYYTTHVEDLRKLFEISGNNNKELIRSLR